MKKIPPDADMPHQVMGEISKTGGM